MDTLRVFIRWCATIDGVPEELHAKVVSPNLSIEEETRDEMLDSEVAEAVLDHLATYEYASVRPVCLLLMWKALLRSGAVRALDVEDYYPREMSIEVNHRPETDTPLKNKHRGERFIGLDDDTCTVLDD